MRIIFPKGAAGEHHWLTQARLFNRRRGQWSEYDKCTCGLAYIGLDPEEREHFVCGEEESGRQEPVDPPPF